MSAERVVSPEEGQEAERRQRPRSAVIFETIRLEGEEQLERRPAALLWSAFAAGLSMSFSLLCAGFLAAHLPPGAPWARLISAFGYTIGFLIVILGRQQLFTENTLTPLLPYFNDAKAWRLRRIARAWALILAGNLVGALLASAVIAFAPAFSPAQRHAFDDIARATSGHPFAVTFFKALFAGWMIALMVWLLPLAEQLAPVIIIVITYFIAAGELQHIVAGSVDAMYGALSGATTWRDFVAFAVPTFLGNALGGVAFVAAISSAEIASERKPPRT